MFAMEPFPTPSGLMKIYFDEHLADQQRRKALHDGQVFVYSANCYSSQLATLAQSLCEDQFFPHHPRIAHRHIRWDDFKCEVQQLNTKFREHPESQRLVAGLLVEMNCAPQETYFCQPHIEVASPANPESSQPSADAWSDSTEPLQPFCSQNWWLPVYPISPNDGPALKETTTTNGQNNALDNTSDVRFVCPPGAMAVTCANRLRPTVSCTVQVSAFNIVFRSVNAADLNYSQLHESSGNATSNLLLPEYKQISTYFKELQFPDWWSEHLNATSPYDSPFE